LGELQRTKVLGGSLEKRNKRKRKIRYAEGSSVGKRVYPASGWWGTTYLITLVNRPYECSKGKNESKIISHVSFHAAGKKNDCP
jgi:hypothetical protein